MVMQQLRPTLFDRLCDDAPSAPTESAAAYVVSASELRAIVKRDLAFLLNATNLDDLIDHRQHGAVASATVSFGIPPLAGTQASERRWVDIERALRRAILDHEPRLLPESVRVTPVSVPRALGGAQILHFEIDALIDARPYPLSLTVQSAFDLETSRVRTAPT